MKKILLSIILIFQINLSSAEDLMRFPVYDLRPYQGFEMMFELATAPRFGKVILDCQSFMHQIQFIKEKSTGEEDIIFKFYIDENECQEIFEFINVSLNNNRHTCIELNSFNGEYFLDRDYKDCY